jgi:hypothetical protein
LWPWTIFLSALGEFVDIGGYAGVIVEIVSNR